MSKITQKKMYINALAGIFCSKIKVPLDLLLKYCVDLNEFNYKNDYVRFTRYSLEFNKNDNLFIYGFDQIYLRHVYLEYIQNLNDKQYNIGIIQHNKQVISRNIINVIFLANQYNKQDSNFKKLLNGLLRYFKLGNNIDISEKLKLLYINTPILSKLYEEKLYNAQFFYTLLNKLKKKKYKQLYY